MKKHLFPITLACLLLISLGIFGGFSAFAKNLAENSIEAYDCLLYTSDAADEL